MKVHRLFPKPDIKVPFNWSNFKMIPKISGCYVLTTFDNEILYIGLAKNLFNRFQQHLSNPEKTETTEFGRAFWFYYLNYELEGLNKLERTWLNEFESNEAKLPVLNKLHSPIS